MATNVTIDIDASGYRDQVNRFLADIDPENLLAAVGNAHLFWINQNFREHGKEQRWAPLAPSTIRQRGANAQPLRDTGRMAQSANVKVNVSASEVAVGFADEKAKWHHFGTKNIPARALLPTIRKATQIATKEVQAIIDVAANRTR